MASSAAAAAMAKAEKCLTAARGKLRRVGDDDTVDMTFSFTENQLGRVQTAYFLGLSPQPRRQKTQLRVALLRVPEISQPICAA
jgi:hypothetical protein